VSHPRAFLVATSLLVVILASRSFAAPEAAAAPAPDPAKKAPTTGAKATTYEVRVRMERAGKTTFVPIGEVSRAADGTITMKARPAPALAALSDKLVAQWAAYKVPDVVRITESVASDTGMRPSYAKHSFDCKKDERLYGPAVVREWLRANNYEELGLSYLNFVVVQRGPEWPPGAHDRASKTIGVTKGTGEDVYGEGQGGERSVIVYAKVRSPTSPGPARASSTNPTVVLAGSNDQGHEEVGRFYIRADGNIRLEKVSAGDAFLREFSIVGRDDVDIGFYTPTGEWARVTVKKDAPHALEAFLLWREQYMFYDVSPAIDPASVR